MSCIQETKTTVWDGIIIGGAGGAIAGIVVWGIQASKEVYYKQIHKKRVYKWIKENTPTVDGKNYRTTRSIASHNNLTEIELDTFVVFIKKSTCLLVRWKTFGG